ncbi:hypothetical protein DFP73DRAFT_600731 [Morchella snyderi]|nr:hypothetical protein DFP73DRAFT_600731 [Morchella snyderi]
MDYIKLNALRAQLDELARQIAVLEIKAKAAEQSKDEHLQPPAYTQRISTRPPAFYGLPLCSRSSPDCRLNTCTAGRGVYLGLVRAGDVADLSGHALKELDDGLKVIVLHLVPRGAGAPSFRSLLAPFPRVREEMIALLSKVSLRVGPLPDSNTTSHYVNFRNPARGRNLRLDDARLGELGDIDESHKGNALYFETFLQLVHFRGIDPEALP